MTSVLLIDDDFELTALLGEYLEQQGFRVSVAGDGERALGRILDARADIVVLDIMMPKVDGLAVLRRIRSESSVPVLMLTARGDEADRIMGLNLGADDYLAKPCSPAELAARIRAILRRTLPSESQVSESASVQREGALSIDRQRRLATWAGTPLALTGVEFNLLDVLVSQTGKPVSRADLSLQGLGRPLAAYDRAVDVHVSSIRQKLSTFDDGRSPIQSLRGVGYVFVRE
ncbi:MAG: response regulator transcription factor [Cypionkella sp.]|uniref:response regulator transcription factor n=1 Tax=Cypionkella sp. TaxID=2811411 RepID=UPI002ABCCBC4|nr:response regulator transcription factor [Cypionkella sp.]MDZ4309262.1 response regulator transcription factor [Cypionkella sp.]MDZ4392649.1 response regulator transcription factor [Cypionkella sp.]